MIVKYNVNNMIFKILLLTITLILMQWTGMCSAFPAADRKVEKRQEEFYRTSTPCSLSFFRYLFNSTVGERIRPPVPEGSSIFGIVVKSPDHYYPETRSGYDQKQEPIPLPSGQKSQSIPPYLPSSPPSKDYLPSAPKQKGYPSPSEFGRESSVIQTPFLDKSGGASSVVQTPVFPTSGGDSSVVQTPFLGNSGGESSVVQTPFIPEAANQIPVQKKVSLVKSAFSSTSAPQPICECATAATKKETEPTKPDEVSSYQDRDGNFKSSQSSEPPFLDISKVPIDDYSAQPTPPKVVSKKKEPVVSSQTVNIDTVIRSNQQPPLPSSHVKVSKKGYGPVAAPSDQFQGYEYPSPSVPFPPSTIEGSYQPAPPKPPTLPVRPPPPPPPPPSPSSESTGYEYPTPNVPFPPSSVGSPFPPESTFLPPSSPQPQPSEGYFYDKPNIPFDLPSKTEFNFAYDNNKVDSVAVQSIDSNNGYKKGGLFRNGDNSFKEAVSSSQSLNDDLLVLHV